jgi:hypothetical protein
MGLCLSLKPEAESLAVIKTKVRPPKKKAMAATP